jgi:hypothetical protein
MRHQGESKAKSIPNSIDMGHRFEELLQIPSVTRNAKECLELKASLEKEQDSM